MRIGRLLLILVLAVLLLLGGAGLWAWNTDLGRFEPQLERLVSQRLGRTLEIDGLSVRLGKTIEISADGLRLANPAWADSPDLLSTGPLSAAVDLSSIFGRPVVIERLVAVDIAIAAEHSEQHGPSWAFGADAPASMTTPPAGPPILIRHSELDELTGKLERPGNLPPIFFEIDTWRGNHRKDDMLELTVLGQLNGEPGEFHGEFGTFTAVLEGRNVRVEGDGRFGSLTLEGRALIDSLTEPRHPEFDLVLKGPDIAAVANMLGLAAPPPAPFRISGQARPADGYLSLVVDAHVGDTRLDLEGRSAGLLDLSRVEYRLSAQGTNLGAFTRMLTLGEWPEESFEASGQVTRDGRLLTLSDIQVVIGEATFDLDGELNNFPDLNNARLRFDLRGDDAEKFRELVGIRGVAVGPFEASGSIQARPDGRDEVELKMQTAMGRAEGIATLGDGPDYIGTEARVTIEGVNAEQLFDGYGIGGFAPDPFTLASNFTVEEGGLRFGRGVLVTLGEDRLEVAGFVSYVDDGQGTDIEVRASGEDLSQFAPLAGLELPVAAQAYTLEAGFRITPEGFRIDGLTGRVGPNDIRLDGLLTRAPGLSGSDFTFALEGPDLHTLIRDTAGFDVPADEFSLAGHLRQLGDALRLEDLALEIGGLSATAELELPDPYDGSRLHLRLDASGPDINALLPKVPGLELKPNRFQVSADVSRGDGRWVFRDTEMLLGDARLRIDGSADLLPEPRDGDLDIDLEAPGLARLGTYRGYPLQDLPVSLTAHLTGEPQQARLESLRAQIGQTDLDGQFSWSTAGAVPNLELTTRSRFIDLMEILDAVVPQRSSDQQGNGAGVGKDGRLIPDVAFPFEDLRKVDARVDLTADEFHGFVRITRNWQLDGHMQDGALFIDHWHAEGFQGSASLSGSLVPEPAAPAALDLDLQVDDLVLDLSRDEDVDPESLPTVNVLVDVNGRGDDLRAVAASLNGHIDADSGPGVIPDSVVSFLDKGLLDQIFSTILPVDDSRTTQLECFAARLIITDGQIAASPGAALVTDKVQMISKGSVDLSTERLSLNFETHPTKAYKANISEVLVNPFVKITGTLAEPALTLDAPRAALFSGAAIATAGLSILAKGLLDRMSQSPDPCGEFMRDGARDSDGDDAVEPGP